MEHLKSTLYKKSKSKTIKIEDSIEGLENYLTAANIRSKIKHPLFLALKFPSCFRIYLEKEDLKKPSSKQSQEYKDLLRLQSTLDAKFFSNFDSFQLQSQVVIIISVEGEKEGELTIQHHQRLNKIFEILFPLQGEFISFQRNLEAQNLENFTYLKITPCIMMAFAQIFSKKEEFNSKFSNKSKKKNQKQQSGSFKLFKVNEAFLKEQTGLQTMQMVDNKDVIKTLRDRMPFKNQGKMHQVLANIREGHFYSKNVRNKGCFLQKRPKPESICDDSLPNEPTGQSDLTISNIPSQLEIPIPPRMNKYFDSLNVDQMIEKNKKIKVSRFPQSANCNKKYSQMTISPDKGYNTMIENFSKNQSLLYAKMIQNSQQLIKDYFNKKDILQAQKPILK